MAYILDPDVNTVDSNVIPIGLSPTTLTSNINTQFKQNLILGNGATSYKFPITKAPTSNYILSDPGTGILEWVANGTGGGNHDHPILNGGQTGSITIGSTDNILKLTTGALLHPQLQLNQDGSIFIGDTLSDNNIIISGGIDFHFKQIIGTDTNYDLTINDYAVEIISATYNTITLPAAVGNAGRTYLISRGSTNDSLKVITQSGETIDGESIAQLRRIYTRLTVMSNGIGSWYIV